VNSADTAGTIDYWNWSSLREIDEANSTRKGSAFRAFKHLLPALIEGVDFILLDHRSNDGLAARWHAADRLYRSSIHPVLVSPQTAKRVVAALGAESH
jgi:hypothetical protein